MREMIIDLARMYHAALSHEFQELLRALAFRRGPSRAAPRIGVLLARIAHLAQSRMHQRLNLAGYKSVVDEEVFLHTERRVASLEVAGAIIEHARAQRQVLCASRRTNWVGLYEAELVQRAFQRRRREETARDRIAAKLIERYPHGACDGSGVYLT